MFFPYIKNCMSFNNTRLKKGLNKQYSSNHTAFLEGKIKETKNTGKQIIICNFSRISTI